MATARAMTPAFPDAWGIQQARSLADGGGGTVWRVVRPEGPAVVKRLSEAALAEAGFAVAWLAAQDGQGAIRLLAQEGEWQLLEDAGLRSTADLLRTEGDEAAARVAADVLKTLHGRSGAGEGLQPLTHRLEPLHAAGRDEGGVFAEASATASRLTAEGVPPRALHGDLHHDNLLHGPRGWLAIDPHGVFGDPAYDAANWLYNPIERPDLRTDPDRAFRLAGLLSPAARRPPAAILDWAFCHAALSASWHREDGDFEETERSLEVARAIRAASVR